MQLYQEQPQQCTESRQLTEKHLQQQQPGVNGGAELVVAQQLATEGPAAAAPRPMAGSQLLAFLPEQALAVAAVGLRLLLLRAVPTAVQPIRCLLDCTEPITAVAASNSDVPGLQPDIPQPHRQHRWVAAIAGRHAHFIVVNSGSDGSVSSSPTSSLSSFSVPAAVQPWQACAWHPRNAVCAVLAPGQLQLVQPAVLPSSGSTTAEVLSLAGKAIPDSLLACVSDPEPGGFGSTTNCCVAWLEAGPPSGGGAVADSSNGGSCLVCWGQQRLELLNFGKGWQRVEQRRQLLLNLPGPVCGLAPFAGGDLLIATKRPVSEWLGAARGEQAEAAAQQQQQHEAERAWDMLQRGLHAAASRPTSVLLLPGSSASSTVWGGGDVDAVAVPAAAMAGAAAGADLPSIDGVLRPAAASGGGAAASIPAFLLLPSEAAQHSAPLRGDLPGSAAANGGGGNGGGGGGSGGVAQVQRVQLSEGHVTLFRSGHFAQTIVQLGVAPDLVQAAGTLAVLSSSRGDPALVVCGMDPVDRSRQQHAVLHLPLPADVPQGCSVSAKGMAATGPSAGASRGGDRLLVWVLLAAAPKAAAAPFLSPALASSGAAGQQPQQHWLCCYRLALDAALVQAAAAVSLKSSEEASLQASRPPGSVLDAVLAMQQAVRELRRELSSRLDGLDEQLAGLVSQLHET